MSFSKSVYLNPPGMQDEFSSMPQLTPDAMPLFMDSNMLFPYSTSKKLSDHSIMEYSDFSGYDGSTYESFEPQQSVRDALPSLELDLYSPIACLISPSLSMNFVVPSQITFANSYDAHSPLHETRSLHAGSPGSTYEHDSMTHSPRSKDDFHMITSEDRASSSMSQSRSSTSHKPVFEPLPSSLDVQRLQPARPGMRQLRKQRMRRGSALAAVPSHIRVQNKAIKKCEWPGCNGKFQRQEHLKRHEKTHINTETFVCQFCQKPFGRSDNLKSHTRLHTNPGKKSSRTMYFPGALEVYQEMSRKPRKSVDLSSSDSKKEQDTSSRLSLRPRASSY